MEYKVDMHNHTWFSDGSKSPTEVVKRAKEKGIGTIAITDHDGVGGIEEALIAGNALDINVIPGIEISAEVNELNLGIKTSVHILGYNIDYKNSILCSKLEHISKMRVERNQKLLKVLKDMGYPLSENDLIEQGSKGYIGKPVIARAMVTKGYIKNLRDAFESGKYLEAPEIKGISKEKIGAEEAISLIKGAGGIAVLAHPGKLTKIGQRHTKEFYDAVIQTVGELKKYGLKGLECIHPNHSSDEVLKFIEIAEKYHLHITEGSDYHGGD